MFRKSKDEVISPRALKHVQHLTRLVEEKDTKCVLLFIVQRTDCVVFQPSKNDPGTLCFKLILSYVEYK